MLLKLKPHLRLNLNFLITNTYKSSKVFFSTNQTKERQENQEQNEKDEKFKKLFSSVEEFESEFEKFLQSDMNKTQNKGRTMKIYEVDMRKSKNKTGSYRKHYKEILIKNEKNEEFSTEKTDNTEDFMIGQKDFYPISSFIDLTQQQFNLNIKLMTYKYPAYYSLLTKPDKQLDSSETTTKQQSKGVVYLFHGLYEYSDYTAYMAKFLSSHGYDILSFDIRGHGRSEGLKGYLDSETILLEDYMSFINKTIPEYDNKPRFIIGYSLGGLVSLIISSKIKVNGVVLLAPPLSSKSLTMKNPYLFKFIRIISSILPSIKVPSPVVYPTSNKAVIDFMNKDKLRLSGFIRPKTLMTLHGLIKMNEEGKTRISSCIYYIQGGRDVFVSLVENGNFLKGVDCEKVIIEANDLEHDVVHDYRIRNYLEDILVWMKEKGEKGEKGRK